MLIAARGTKGIRNFYADAKFVEYSFVSDSLKKNYFLLPQGHAGFRKSIMELQNQQKLFATINNFVHNKYIKSGLYKKKSDIPVYLTGHSLGAALCSMLAMPLRQNSLFVDGMYLFAPPLAISCEEKLIHENYFGKTTYNIVNFKDLIPRLGLRGTLTHFGSFYRICDDSLLRKEPERYVPMVGIENFLVLKYHSMVNHLDLIRTTSNSDTEVFNRLQNNEDCMECEVIINPCDAGDRKHPCDK